MMLDTYLTLSNCHCRPNTEDTPSKDALEWLRRRAESEVVDTDGLLLGASASGSRMSRARRVPDSLLNCELQSR